MSVLTLREAEIHLNITNPTGETEAELQTFIDAAEAALASSRVGPIAPVTKTARVSGGGRTLLLPVAPAVSLTSVTPTGGTALTLADLYLDKVAATVAYTSDSPFTAFWYDVVYVAGRAANDVPDDLLWVNKELLRLMWSAQRPFGGRFASAPASAEPNTSIPGTARLLDQLLADYPPKVGFA
jgi:hypothetical protein